jgi:hypothetical protein
MESQLFSSNWSTNWITIPSQFSRVSEYIIYHQSISHFHHVRRLEIKIWIPRAHLKPATDQLAREALTFWRLIQLAEESSNQYSKRQNKVCSRENNMPPSQPPPLANVPRSIEVSSSAEKHFQKAQKEKRRYAPKPDSLADSVRGTDVSGTGEEPQDGEEPGTKQLLAYANIRVEHQKMKEDMKALKAMLAAKDEQLLQLTCQLRRATASKWDLVVACTDMERQMEAVEKYGSPQSQQVRQQYLEMLEGRATMEREFMNELQTLTNELLATDRRYMNQLVDKDFTIGQLEEQVRRLRAQLEENSLAEQDRGAAKPLEATTE